MQTIAKSAQRSAVAKTAAARTQKPMVVRGAVKCQASKQAVQKAAAAATSLPALLAANPAFALVDDRLNGDGVGYPLGISDPALGWVFVGVASLVWILYFIAQKDFGDFEDKDSGVGL